MRERHPDPGHPKVLHLGHTGAAGGAEFALLRMLQAGVAWRPALLLPPLGEPGVFRALPPQVPLRTSGVRQPSGVSAGSVLLVADATVRLIAQAVATRAHPGYARADIVDANTTRSAAYGALAARASRKPFVVHMRDMADAAAIGRAGFETMRRIVLPRADGIVADTQATLDSALPHIRASAVTAVIPSASGLREPSSAKALSTGGVMRVGMLARIDPWKGQALLIEAFAQALGDTDAELEFAGEAYFGHEPYLRSLKERAAELGIADRVRFLGHVARVDDVLDGWDVAVQASMRPEPLGQNVLQALAAGRVVVVADEGGPTEWVRDGVNGLRFHPHDAASLAGVLARLAEDPGLRVRLGASASATPGLLTDEAVSDRHARFYEEVLGAVGRR